MAATEDTIRSILLQIDTTPDDWQNLCGLLADACRDCGQDAVADAIAAIVEHGIYVLRRWSRSVTTWLIEPYYSPHLTRADRRWVARVMLPYVGR